MVSPPIYNKGDYMIIYKFTNSITGQVYIGKTVQSIEKRVKGHLRYCQKGNSTKLANSINKYGWDNFSVEVLEEVVNKEELNEREIYWINKYDSYQNGLNSTLGGDGGDRSEFIDYKNRKDIYTDELREKRRQQLLNKNPNNIPGVREKISKSKKGHKKNEEWIQKIKDSKKRNGFSWKGKNNPNYVQVTEDQKRIILENKDKVKTKKELVNMTGLSYFMLNKLINGKKKD